MWNDSPVAAMPTARRQPCLADTHELAKQRQPVTLSQCCQRANGVVMIHVLTIQELLK
jgi:hypothetical protein